MAGRGGHSLFDLSTQTIRPPGSSHDGLTVFGYFAPSDFEWTAVRHCASAAFLEAHLAGVLKEGAHSVGGAVG